MHLHCYRVRNYRRMRDALIDLAPDFSIFVGANNSGKTSATQVVQSFITGAKEKISLHDFSSHIWKELDNIGSDQNLAAENAIVPSITLDLWFTVNEHDLYLIIPLLPSTEWQGTEIGIRIEFGARNPTSLITNFRTAHAEANRKAAELPEGAGDYRPWPGSLTDYLQRELKSECEFKYYVLDRAQFDDNYVEQAGYTPSLLEKDPSGAAIIKSIIRVDTLNAQRHLADSSVEPTPGGGRSEDLSKRLSKFYKRNLDQMQDDHSALKALSQSEIGLNEHLGKVFEETLKRLSKLGYPGVSNPKLLIKSALNPATVLTQDARVHYKVGGEENGVELPDTYNGLGFKNLIYMVVEILDLQEKWKAQKENRPPLHLIFVEEPEAHLHTQLQQVFIRNVLELLKIDGDNAAFFKTQLAITTHSSHILYERGFTPIRYFKRASSDDAPQTTEVLNLSKYYRSCPQDSDFLQKYLKLTHCDLFFADAAILVEGNVERLLIPAMIGKAAVKLQSACVCLLEVGGAFGHKFKSLIEFLGLTTLIITDIDSVAIVAAGNADAADYEDDTEFEVPDANPGSPRIQKKGKACRTDTENAATSNQTLIQWLPKKTTIADLWAATADEKTSIVGGPINSKVHVAYQTRVTVTLGAETKALCGRTLEEMFGLENFEWCQHADNHHVGLRLKPAPTSLEALADGLYKKVKGSGFDKTKFAIGVLTSTQDTWIVPSYIRDGLVWLEGHVSTDAAIDQAIEGADELNAALAAA